MHHIWGCDHYKTTLNALKFKQAYKRRTDMVKDAMSAVPWGDRPAMVAAIMDAIKKGGLFSVDVDIIPTQIGQASHVWLPAATSGEMNLTSMNGERRMRLTERYMDPPGRAMPDCLIAARIANHMERVFREQGKTEVADRFKGFDWKTEEDAFMDGYHKHEKGGEFVTYARLRAMGTNGFQEPAVGIEGGPVAAGSSQGQTTTGQQPGMVVQGRDRGRARQGARAAGRRQRCRGSRPDRRDGAHHRHEAPLRRRQVQHEGRQGHLHGDEVARPAGRRQGGGVEEVPLPHQQRAHKPHLAERLSRPAERVRDGPLSRCRSSR